MTEDRIKSVKLKLSEIMATQAMYEMRMKQLRTELIQYAKYFSSYGEMYAFIKQNTPDQRSFNLDMMEAMEVFYKYHGE